jgi:hypothetical protein
MSYRHCQLAGPAARGRAGARRRGLRSAKGQQDAAARRSRLLRRLGFQRASLPCECWSFRQTQLCSLINKLQNCTRSSALITPVCVCAPPLLFVVPGPKCPRLADGSFRGRCSPLLSKGLLCYLCSPLLWKGGDVSQVVVDSEQ